MRPPRLRDVAELAGVSEPTVSRVLNGRTGVARATRDKVVDALAELGFDDAPPPVRSRSSVIGMLSGALTNPVFPLMISHIGSKLAAEGYLCTIALVDERQNPEERCIAEFIRAGVDGVIVVGGRHAELEADLSHYNDLIRRNIALVLVNGRATDLDVPHIRCDEGAATRLGVTHLTHLGHQRIGCIVGGERYATTARTIDGYWTALADAGIRKKAGRVVHTEFTFEAARAVATRMIDDGFTGFVTSNDQMALGVITAARAVGLSVPEDISVVGYDGTDFTAFTQPPLTTLRQPFEDMAALVSNSMLAELREDRTCRDHFVFEAELLARESSGPAPATA